MNFLDRSRTVAPPGWSRWLVPPAALAVHLPPAALAVHLPLARPGDVLNSSGFPRAGARRPGTAGP
ncbi:hypothetical protein EAO68_26450 [Streptomyces sp. wa22]|nr:hypothetical protein EAO68_26450 [Streptomyces sp. wa22]